MKKVLGILGIINIMASSAPLTIAATLNNVSENQKCIEQEAPIEENIEIATPIAHVAGFYLNDSVENTFAWRTTLPIGSKYRNLKIKINDNTEYWVESYMTGFKNQNTSNLFKVMKNDMTNILLVNNTKVEKTIAEISYDYRSATSSVCAYSCIDIPNYFIQIANLKLILNLEYANNIIKIKFTAKSTVKNPKLLWWVKAQAKFNFKIIVSE